MLLNAYALPPGKALLGWRQSVCVTLRVWRMFGGTANILDKRGPNGAFPTSNAPLCGAGQSHALWAWSFTAIPRLGWLIGNSGIFGNREPRIPHYKKNHGSLTPGEIQ